MLVIVMVATLVPFAAFAEGNSSFKASEEILTIIKNFEGFRSKAYRATSGEEYLTIGYGHYGADVKEDMEISKAEADTLFRNDIVKYENAVNRFFNQHNLTYSQQVFDAVLSLTYNIGTSWMDAGNYRIRNYLINGLDKYDDVEVADAMGVLCAANGTIYPSLINRRIKETRIMLYGDYEGNASPDFVYLILNANGGTLNNGNRVVIYSKGDIYGSLPGAYKDNCILSGWQSNSGVDIKSTDIAAESISVKAIWKSGAPKEYQLTVVGGKGTGKYAQGETVTIRPNGNDFLAWRSGDVKIISDGAKYTLKMPGSSIAVTTIVDYNCEGKFCPAESFTDIGSDYWSHEAIDFVYANDLFKGYSDTVFKPTVTMTRGMLITVLYRLNGSPSIKGYDNPFSDVASDSPYHDAILWGYHNRIANGFADGDFHPNDTLKREQLATFLLRYANYMGYDTNSYADISGYSDVNLINDYADEAMCWAVGSGIINGTSYTTLSPQDGATRAQVATMVMRFVKNVVAGAIVKELT